MKTQGSDRDHPAEAAARGGAKDEILLAALAAGKSYTIAGSAAGVSARTVRRKMADPSFAAEVAEHRRLYVNEVVGLLLASGTAAVEVVRECLNSDKPSDRLRAAELLLVLGRRVYADPDVQERLALLEADRDARLKEATS